MVDDSVFSQDQAYLMRLHELLLRCNECSMVQDLQGRFWVLSALFQELSCLMDSELLDYHKKRRLDCENSIKIFVRRNNPRIVRKYPGSNSGGVSIRVFDSLDVWERDLRFFMFKKGLLLAKTDSEESTLL